MITLVVYSSRTGNTKKIADAIYDIMPEGSKIAPVKLDWKVKVICSYAKLFFINFYYSEVGAFGTTGEDST